MFKKGDRVHSIKPVGEKRITGAIGIVVMQPQPPTLLVRFETNIGGWAYQGILNHWWCNESELAAPPTIFQIDLRAYLEEELK